MRDHKMTPEEMLEIEIRHLKEAAARYGGVLAAARERERKAMRRAKEAYACPAGEGTECTKS